MNYEGGEGRRLETGDRRREAGSGNRRHGAHGVTRPTGAALDDANTPLLDGASFTF
jgi:hypothetical protein